MLSTEHTQKSQARNVCSKLKLLFILHPYYLYPSDRDYPQTVCHWPALNTGCNSELTDTAMAVCCVVDWNNHNHRTWTSSSPMTITVSYRGCGARVRVFTPIHPTINQIWNKWSLYYKTAIALQNQLKITAPSFKNNQHRPESHMLSVSYQG